ncbi:MAG: DUF5618 family protein [bacterium]
MKEGLRYLNNAKEILRNAPIEENNYTDVKYVQEACGTAYLAILKAINEYLLNKGLTKKELPKSYETYTKALRKHLSIHNGKLFKQFDYLYDELHIAGYYRGDLHNVNAVKAILKSAKDFIEKMG